jgi:uncharacterized iron-regulated protein
MTKTAALALIVAILLLLPPYRAARAGDALQFYDLAAGQVVSENDFASRLTGHRFVLIGERHNKADHHQGQLAVLKLLAGRGVPMVIGMEMMRSDSQAFLDAWVAGTLAEAEFEAVYRDNWNFPWPLYRPIFLFARERRIPVIGLNVPRAITRQVAREGFDALSPDQRRGLPFVACRIDDAYMDYIRTAYGAHGHSRMTFDHFCEAQLVWDKTMAANALQYSRKSPDRTMVILAGTGHARKGGIPRQLAALGSRSYQVVLPEVPALLDPTVSSVADADFLLQRR